MSAGITFVVTVVYSHILDVNVTLDAANILMYL